MTENPFEEAETTYELLGLLAGASSMCWENIMDAGVYKMDLASKLVDDAHDKLIELRLKETND